MPCYHTKVILWLLKPWAKQCNQERSQEHHVSSKPPNSSQHVPTLLPPALSLQLPHPSVSVLTGDPGEGQLLSPTLSVSMVYKLQDWKAGQGSHKATEGRPRGPKSWMCYLSTAGQHSWGAVMQLPTADDPEQPASHPTSEAGLSTLRWHCAHRQGGPASLCLPSLSCHTVP